MKQRLPATITSTHHPLIRRFRRAFARSGRKEEVLAVEGPRLVSEALACDLVPECVLVSQTFQRSSDWKGLNQRLLATCPDFRVGEDRVVLAAADSEHAQGLLVLVRRNPASRTIAPPGKEDLSLALVDLQDPGNVGTMSRTFWALGGRSLYTVGSTADLFGTKALRASAGAAFHLAVLHFENETVFLDYCTGAGISPLAACPEGGEDPARIKVWPPAVLLIGNEGAGLSAGLKVHCRQILTLPMLPGRNSLNAAVAGSLILYELTRLLRTGPFAGNWNG